MKSILLLLFAALWGASLSAQAPTPLQLELVQVAINMNAPIGVYCPGDERMFILEQSQSDIEIFDTTGTYIGKFLDMTGMVSSGSERGLLGLAFHPDYFNNGRFFINYTDLAGSTVIAEYSVSANPNIADAASAQILMTIAQPFANHNGGHIAFGPDGYLYIGMGDGGSGGDPGNRSQNPSLLLGKMLRIDVDNGSPYGIPPTNPFINTPGYLPEIWAMGVRNPWKFSFDRVTGDLWIGDVGQNAWEEIDFEPAGSPGGKNWGWRCYEGNAAYNTAGCQPQSSYDSPAAVYSHAAPNNFCSITGGIVYRGSRFPGMVGQYIFCDFCNADFYSLSPDGNGGYTETLALVTAGSGYPAFGEDANGELYVVRTSGVLYRLDDACGSFMPSVNSDSNGSLTCDGPSTIWWWKDGVLIPGATGSNYIPEESGSYYATATTSAGCVRQSNSVQWLVNSGIPGCTYPEAINFNPDAEADDGSCDFGLGGCTYPTAVNFNPDAINDDGTCVFGIPGCTYETAINYNPAATADDGSCNFGLAGCTYSQGANFNPLALVDDGSCTFPNNADCPVDLNSDGLVNVPDLLLFVAAWGQACD